MPVENYNKRCKFLGKKTKRERIKQKTFHPNIIKNFKSDIYPSYKFSKASFNYNTNFFNGKNAYHE